MTNFKDFFNNLTYNNAILCNNIFKIVDCDKLELLNNDNNNYRNADVWQSFLCSDINDNYNVNNNCCNIYYYEILDLYIINILHFGIPWDSLNVDFNC